MSSPKELLEEETKYLDVKFRGSNIQDDILIDLDLDVDDVHLDQSIKREIKKQVNF